MNRAKETSVAYYSPLSANSFENGTIKPGPCAFSTPKVTYSQETKDLMKLLMNETRLTTTQRRGFESLLRCGDVAPEPRSTAFARRQEYLSRRVNRGRGLGLDMPLGRVNVVKMRQMQSGLGKGKRTLETIQATTDVFQGREQKQRTYIPVNKEAEKARFSYKMAYGKDPSPEIMDRLMGVIKRKSVAGNQDDPGQKVKSDEELKMERYKELIEEIQERVDFLDTTKQAKRDKEYSGYMTFQISEKLQEVKSLFPKKVNDLVSKLHLEEIDPVFTNFR